ncbi:MAG: ribosome hibernation-promoting factor, HPF/YfiA family [Candidatus Bipolaricaulia bacterium]
MKINITDRRAHSSDALQEYVLDKVEPLERFFVDGIISVDVVLDTEGNSQICELVGHLVRKKIVKATAEADEMHAAVDAGVDKLKTQIIKEKDRLRENPKQKTATPPEPPQSADHTEGAHRTFSRSQVYVRKPMTPDEAIMQLESYEKRDFLIFMDAEREALSIMRRLPNGQYELLEPVY